MYATGSIPDTDTAKPTSLTPWLHYFTRSCHGLRADVSCPDCQRARTSACHGTAAADTGRSAVSAYM